MRHRMQSIIMGVAALACLSVLTGCTIHLRFFPVTGPAASANPNQVFVGKLTASSAFNPKSGGFAAVLTGGEAFQGSWTMVRPDSASQGALAGTKPILAAWDSVYGKGFYTAHVLGQREYGRSVITGGKGTILQAEICATSPDPGSTRAVAQDSKGNIYKITPY